MTARVNFTITPGIDQRMNSWQKKSKEHKPETAPCITISREFGCEAYPVAEKLQQKLSNSTGSEWLVLDAKLLDKIAEESGYSVADIQHAGDTNPIFHSMMSLFMGKQRPEQFEIFSYIKKAIRHFAKAGNCIIIGRGGVNITQNLSNCVHFRLVAPFEFRVKKLASIQDIDENEARQIIQERQNQRDDFINRFTGSSASDSSLYHLVINNGKYTPDQIAEIIEWTVSQTLGK
ncbi:MAG: cytidylate kinase-like family protein [SAR324 cluster bacterium]|nr:cytidylate kinase-like family protein [SAR324 cluster bacterium]